MRFIQILCLAAFSPGVHSIDPHYMKHNDSNLACTYKCKWEGERCVWNDKCTCIDKAVCPAWQKWSFHQKSLDQEWVPAHSQLQSEENDESSQTQKHSQESVPVPVPGPTKADPAAASPYNVIELAPRKGYIPNNVTVVDRRRLLTRQSLIDRLLTEKRRASQRDGN